MYISYGLGALTPTKERARRKATGTEEYHHRREDPRMAKDKK